MSKEELDIFEDKLSKAGYKRHTVALSAHEDWGWFKSFFEEDGTSDDDEEKKRKTMIEFRVWDFGKYKTEDPYIKNNPYSIDTLIIDGDSSYRIDLEITSPKFDIKTTESLAHALHETLKPYVEENKDNTWEKIIEYED